MFQVYDGIDPFEDPVDRFLAEIALSLQLPPSLHAKAGERYEAVRQKLEQHPNFQGMIEHFYPQGSMSIDATISTKGTDDEYDLDIVAQLGGRFKEMEPLQILTELEAGLKDYPVQKVLRQTRCVTLKYADKMHLDITPTLRLDNSPERESVIAHAKGPQRQAKDTFVDMNAYAFAEWYKQRTPMEQRFAKAFHGRWMALDEAYRAEAEVDDVPEQTNFIVKNTATLALQLLKRFRNIRYADYEGGRTPPSVVLSFYAGMAAQPNTPLATMLTRIANFLVRDIRQASLWGKPLHVANPQCQNDVLTDRWPEAIEQQNEFATHLEDLVKGLEVVRSKTLNPAAISDWMRGNFGEQVVSKAADRIAKKMGMTVKSAEQQYTRKGRVLLPASCGGLVSAVNSSAPASAHTFYGVKI